MKPFQKLQILLFFTALMCLSACSGEQVVAVLAEDVPVEPQQAEVVLVSDFINQAPINFVVKAEPVAAKAIYVTANRAGGSSYLDEIIELCNETEINSVVIDVKTDDGRIMYKGIPVADEMELSVNVIPDVGALMEKLKENNLTPIARVVCFKDNGAAEKRPELYIKDENGEVWRDSSKLKSAWLNPYNKDSWEYILDIAKAAAQAGFKEIQFDYIRFDTSPRLETADFGDTEGKDRKEIILEFVKYAVASLKPYGVAVSADVYGTVINSNVDAAIVGQDYTEMSKYLDYICPMVYPSHYAPGSMGLEYPDIEPYETVLRSMELSKQRLADIPEGEHRAIVRPWLQDFTATWIKPHLEYGGKERKEQIQAVYDAGLTEWILWDAAVRYDAEGLEAASPN